MAKVKEPSTTYYSKPVFKAKKAKLVERIKKETNPEKIEQCLEILGEDLEYNEAYFESLINDVSLKDAPMPGIVTSDEELRLPKPVDWLMMRKLMLFSNGCSQSKME